MINTNTVIWLLLLVVILALFCQRGVFNVKEFYSPSLKSYWKHSNKILDNVFPWYPVHPIYGVFPKMPPKTEKQSYLYARNFDRLRRKHGRGVPIVFNNPHFDTSY